MSESNWLSAQTEPFESQPADLSTFNGVVADWLRKSTQDVAEVTEVRAYGNDWAGDTEAGFHDESDVTIYYVATDGSKRSTSVSGEEMASLWDHVMHAWPQDPT